MTLQLNHQDAIRKKYSSPSASDTDPLEEVISTRVLDVEEGDDNSSVCSNSGVPKPKTGMQSSLVSAGRGSLPRHSNRGFAHQPSKHPYSTSASDSEDAYVPENNLSKTLSQSRSSLASQGSNVTIKSNGSGGAFRRSKARSSVASTRSSASDRTITNETEKHEEYIWDSRENFNFNSSDNKETAANKSLSMDVSGSASSHKGSNDGNQEDKTDYAVPRKFETAKSVDSGIDLQSSQTSQNSPPQKVVHLQPIQAESDVTLSLSSNTSSEVQSPEQPPEGNHPLTKLTTFQPVKPVLTGQKMTSFSRTGGAFAPPTKPPQPPLPPKPSVVSTSSSSNNKPWYQQSDSEQGEGTKVEDIASVKGSSVTSSTDLDPSVLAQKVMNETMIHKKKLDAMQKWSSQNLQQKRLAREIEEMKLSAGEGDSEAEGQWMGHHQVEGSVKSVESSEVDVSSTLTESSGEGVNSTATTSSTHRTSIHSKLESNGGTQDSHKVSSQPGNGQPISVGNTPKLVNIPEHSHINKPKNKAIVVNTLKDNSSTFTIPSHNNNNSTKTAPMLVAPSVPDLQDEIIERQLNRLNEGLATIPEYGVSQFSSTDTDYEHMPGVGHHSQVQSKGALKSARARSAVRQKVVKFKDEVGGNIESPNEDFMQVFYFLN